MVAPIFAALPLIFQAISSSVDLFNEGKKVFEDITGRPSTATKPVDLQAEVASLPVDQVASWSVAMDKRREQYIAETGRLTSEQGELTAEILTAMGPEAAKEVAIMRMTTRPKVVLQMRHVVMLPVYIFCIDAGFMMINNAMKVVGLTGRFDLLADVLFMEGSIYFQLYSWAAPTAASVIIAYMTLKSGEQGQANAGQATGGIGSAINGLVTATRGIGSVFTKRK
jgi:hypothetical protein